MDRSSALAFFAVFASATLAGCATEPGKYPSFAIPQSADPDGQGGRVSGTLSPAFDTALADPAELAPPLPEDLDARIAALAEAGEEAQRAFDRASDDASRLVDAARGTDTTSERWMRAQVALADLTSYRSRTRLALADIDSIAASADVTALDDPAAAAITATQSRLMAYVNAQSQRLAELYSVLEL